MKVGPRVLDFGRVCAASRNVRYLGVTNPLHVSVHVVLAVNRIDELSSSENVSQVNTELCIICQS